MSAPAPIGDVLRRLAERVANGWTSPPVWAEVTQILALADALDRITPVLAGWLRKLEPLGHGNPEPIFVARNARLMAPVRVMKERHIALSLTQALEPAGSHGGHIGVMRAVGWDMAFRAAELGLSEGSRIDLAYRIRENDHPDFGGIEVEIAGIEPASD